MAHTTAEQILSQHSDGRLHGVRHGEVTLAQGDTCGNPASTKDVIYGPARVSMMQYPDGSIEVEVHEA